MSPPNIQVARPNFFPFQLDSFNLHDSSWCVCFCILDIANSRLLWTFTPSDEIWAALSKASYAFGGQQVLYKQNICSSFYMKTVEWKTRKNYKLIFSCLWDEIRSLKDLVCFGFFFVCLSLIAGLICHKTYVKLLSKVVDKHFTLYSWIHKTVLFAQFSCQYFMCTIHFISSPNAAASLHNESKSCLQC